VTYQCQYFTINSSISECDHKYETRNAEPEIGTDRSSKTRRNPRVDGYGSGFGPPRISGSGFWTVLELNRPVFAGQTRIAGGLPEPVANTTAAREADNLSTRGFSMTISASYPRITMIFKMTIHIPMTTLCGNHSGNQCASGHEWIPSHQHFQNESWQFSKLLRWRYPYILKIRRSIVRALTPAFGLIGIRMVITVYGCKRGPK